ncbi:hypothetical protein [Aquabacterium sp. J223]|uniref:hypothetical protein n=1 Tax=Aquabacterium sp. J223 TaxID=2898431 RepID=UPI0021AE1B71|nr:hypothetical protein [Aquabacterium sp. J223]UUX95488.1 hypothetical protein LRS07_20150 [Aquabacterium sp. J223]
MGADARPKRTLIAYCVLADRLQQPGLGIGQAITPFLAEACQEFAGDLFDAAKFCNAVAQRFGISIPRLAALGLTEQLAAEGILLLVSGHASSAVYRYAPGKTIGDVAAAPPVTEADVENVLNSFLEYCRTDGRIEGKEQSWLEAAFLDRLLNVDSMRLLTRREVSISAKRTAETITLKKPQPKAERSDPEELHLDFLVSQFLLDLRSNYPQAFDRVSNVAFANMAAEAIACFREPSGDNAPLDGLTVYLDSPLLLDMLGVNGEYEEYGLELLEAIHEGGAKPAVFDHCVAEAETAVKARLEFLRSGINQVASGWGTTAAPTALAALTGRVAERAEQRLGIAVHRDPETPLHRKSMTSVGDIESYMSSRMQAWRNDEAKAHDRKSVWSMISLRDTGDVCTRLCDAKALLLTRNTALVGIANESWRLWLKGATSHAAAKIERGVPVALSDKQFAGYLWLRKGGGDGKISRARLLAHCSAAVRPRPDIKARAYNLMLELSGKEAAQDIAALLEDREGASALMRATRGDPEDVTKERLPFILEKVKLAAGDYAAEAERKKAEAAIAAVKAGHAVVVEQLSTAMSAASEAHARDAKLLREEIERQRLAAESHEISKGKLERTVGELMEAERQRRAQVAAEGMRAGRSVYRRLRFEIAGLFGALTLLGTSLAESEPGISAGLTVLLAVLGFWFIPDKLRGPLARHAHSHMRAVMARRDSSVPVPDEIPDLK